MYLVDLLKKESVRKYIYRVLVAVVPLLVYYGWLSSAVAPQIISAVAAMLGLSLAHAFVPNSEDVSSNVETNTEDSTDVELSVTSEEINK